MKRQYFAPQIEVIRNDELCETVPVHFFQPGTGVVDGKETEFEEPGLPSGVFDGFMPTPDGQVFWTEG